MACPVAFTASRLVEVPRVPSPVQLMHSGAVISALRRWADQESKGILSYSSYYVSYFLYGELRNKLGVSRMFIKLTLTQLYPISVF